MADELLDLFTEGSVGVEAIPPPIPSDMSARDNWARQNIPGYLEGAVTVDMGTAVDGSTAAVTDSVAQNFDMTALESLQIIVNDYEGRKNSAGKAGTAISGPGPALLSTNASADQFKISLHGETAQNVDIGTTAGGVALAAAMQSGVRALTHAVARNAQAYDGFTAEYVPPSFETTLAVTLAAGVKVRQLTLTSVYGLNRGDVIEITDVTSTLETVFSLTVMDIDRNRKIVYTDPKTPTQIVEATATVKIRDDYYSFTSGKKGADSSIVFTAGAATDLSAGIKVTAATGGAGVDGHDANGIQTIPFVTADFTNDAAATAAQVVVAINKVLTGAVASVSTSKVRITSDLFGARANLTPVAGGANTVLGFATTIEVGTENAFQLSLMDPTILSIQKYTISSGAAGVYIMDTSIVRVDRDKLVSVSATGYSSSGTIGWIVTSTPRAAL